MKKIAIVTSGYLPVPATKGGGVEVLDEYLIKENEKNNYVDLTVFSSDDKEARKQAENYQNTKIVFIRTPKYIQLVDRLIFKIANNILKKANSNSFRYILQRLYYINKVSIELSKADYNSLVLENHATLFSVLRGHRNYQRYRGKYYFHLHNEVKSSYRNDKYIQNVTKVLGVSNYINGTLKKKYPSMNDNQFAVVRNAVDHERFALNLSKDEKKKIRAQFGVPEDNFVFLYTGRLNKEKGILEAVEAFKKANLEKATFLVVGSAFFDTDIKSDFELKLEEVIKSVGNSIKFTGYVPNEKLGRIYSIADVCVVPSIWEDPAPLTIIEAINAGKAIITTNSGGIPEYVNDRNAIILLKEKNIVEKLCKSIKVLSSSKNVLRRMQTNSKQNSSRFSMEIMASTFYGMIQNQDRNE